MKPSRNPATEIVGIALSRWMVTVAAFNFAAITISLHWVWPQITRTDEATYFDIGPLCFGIASRQSDGTTREENNGPVV